MNITIVESAIEARTFIIKNFPCTTLLRYAVEVLKEAGSCRIGARGSAVIDWRSGTWAIRSARSRLWSLLGIKMSGEFHSFSGESGR